MVSIAAVVFIVLILGGLAWAHFIGGKDDKPGNGAAATGKTTSASGVPQETFESVAASIESKDLTGLRTRYANQVTVIVVKTSTKKKVSASDVQALIGNPLNSAVAPWNWHVPSDQLSQWQQGPYGEYFTEDHTIGISDDGTVISIGYDEDGNIDEIFIASVEDLVPPSDPGGGGSTTTPSGDSNNPSTPDGPTSSDPSFSD